MNLLPFAFVRSRYRWAVAGAIAYTALCATFTLHTVFALDSAEPAGDVEADAVVYSRDIAPLLETYCADCHTGFEAKSDFVVSDAEGLLAGGEEAGSAVIPGDPRNSPLLQYVLGERTPQMPDKAPPLPDEHIALLERWIAEGAKFDVPAPPPTHLKPPDRPPFPELPKGDARLEYYLAKRQKRIQLLSAPRVPVSKSKPPANEIDRFFASRMETLAHPTEYPLCDDETFARRVYLDLIGIAPPLNELNAFLESEGADKREQLIDDLLGRDKLYAEHWTTFWEGALSSNNKDEGKIGTRRDLRDYIYRSFERNEPYDLFVARLLDPLLPGYQSRYIIRLNRANIMQNAAATGQVFLGASMQCAMCHNNFENPSWSQRRFLGFASFFNASDFELIRCEVRSGQIIEAQFPYELPEMRLDAPAGVNKRAAWVSALLVDPTNPRFATTIVNRLWDRYIGIGLHEPVDDYRDNQTPSDPDLLEWLAYDFAVNDFDLKHTIRKILTSRVYQHRYDADLADVISVQGVSNRALFRSPQLRRITAEQYIESARSILGYPWDGEARVFRQNTVTPFAQALGRPLTFIVASTSREESVAVPQALHLLNNPEYHEMVYESPVVAEYARRLRTATPPQQRDLFREMFRRVLTRTPSHDELRTLHKYYLANRAELTPRGATGDIFWALLTSPEFQYID